MSAGHETNDLGKGQLLSYVIACHPYTIKYSNYTGDKKGGPRRLNVFNNNFCHC